MSEQNGRAASGRPAREYLEAGAKILGARASEYDQPGGERSAGKVAAAWRAITGKSMTTTEAWLFLALLKLSRLQQAPGPHHDSATDAAVYSALMGESKERRCADGEPAPEEGTPRDACQPGRDELRPEYDLNTLKAVPREKRVKAGGPVSSGPTEKGGVPPSAPGSTLTADVAGCARCGGTHRGLVFRRMARPLAYPDELGALTHFAPCPVTGDPVLLGTTPDAPTHTERGPAQTVEGYASAWTGCPRRAEAEAALRAEAAAPWGKMPPADLLEQIGTAAGGVLCWEFGGRWWEFGLHMPEPRETSGPGAAMEAEVTRAAERLGCPREKLVPAASEVRPDRFAVQLSERSWCGTPPADVVGHPQGAAWLDEAEAVRVARRYGGRAVLHPLYSGPMDPRAKQAAAGKPGLPTGFDSGNVKGPPSASRSSLRSVFGLATGMRPGTDEFEQAWRATERFVSRKAWSLGDGETLDQRMRDDAFSARGCAENPGPTAERSDRPPPL